MCSCEPDFTCSACRGTAADPRYLLDPDPSETPVEPQEVREDAAVL